MSQLNRASTKMTRPLQQTVAVHEKAGIQRHIFPEEDVHCRLCLKMKPNYGHDPHLAESFVHDAQRGKHLDDRSDREADRHEPKQTRASQLGLGDPLISEPVGTERGPGHEVGERVSRPD